MDNSNTKYPNPDRIPKKYPQKDLHGRVRVSHMFYRDIQRFQQFYVNVFGWDMFRLPPAGGGTPPDSVTPTLCTTSGPAQHSWEASEPGHIVLIAEYDDREGEPIRSPYFWMEMHADPDVKANDTIAEIVSHGGKVTHSDGSDPSIPDWGKKFMLEDAAGNEIRLWKCSPSRSWTEPETQWDEEE